MRPIFTTTLAIVLTGCAHPAAVMAPAGTVAAVNPAFATLGFYVGRWQCDGSELDPQGSVSKRYPELVVSVTPDYVGWLRIVVLDHGLQVTAEDVGVDVKGVFHHVWTNDDGSYGSLTSSGWSGASLVFEDDHPGTDRTRMVFTKLDADHYTHVAEVDKGHGYQREFVKRCHRA